MRPKACRRRTRASRSSTRSAARWRRRRAHPRAAARERSFSSHVSHQLRTPVAAMRVAIEAELDRPRDDHAGAAREPRSARPPRVDDREHAGARPSRPASGSRARCRRSSPTTAPAGSRATPRSGGRSATAARRWGEVDVTAIDHILDVLLDNALVHGAGTVTVSTNTAASRSRSTSATTAAGVPPTPSRSSAPTRATASGCAWPARWPSGRRLLGLASTSPTVFRLTLPLRR